MSPEGPARVLMATEQTETQPGAAIDKGILNPKSMPPMLQTRCRVEAWSAARTRPAAERCSIGSCQCDHPPWTCNSVSKAFSRTPSPLKETGTGKFAPHLGLCSKAWSVQPKIQPGQRLRSAKLRGLRSCPGFAKPWLRRKAFSAAVLQPKVLKAPEPSQSQGFGPFYSWQSRARNFQGLSEVSYEASLCNPSP